MNFSSAKLWRNGVELTDQATGSCEMTDGQPSSCRGTLEVPKRDHAWHKVINGVEGQGASFVLRIDDALILEVVGEDECMPVDRGEVGSFRFKGVRQLDREEYARACGEPADSPA